MSTIYVNPLLSITTIRRVIKKLTKEYSIGKAVISKVQSLLNLASLLCTHSHVSDNGDNKSVNALNTRQQVLGKLKKLETYNKLFEKYVEFINQLEQLKSIVVNEYAINNSTIADKLVGDINKLISNFKELIDKFSLSIEPVHLPKSYVDISKSLQKWFKERNLSKPIVKNIFTYNNGSLYFFTYYIFKNLSDVDGFIYKKYYVISKLSFSNTGNNSYEYSITVCQSLKSPYSLIYDRGWTTIDKQEILDYTNRLMVADGVLK